jgi:acylpyruvate hydrolase
VYYTHLGIGSPQRRLIRAITGEQLKEWEGHDQGDEDGLCMRLVTVRTEAGTRAARVNGETLTLLPYDDVGAALWSDDWAQALAASKGEEIDAAGADLAPVIPRPEKILGVGLNYKSHANEADMDPTTYPMLFAKFWRCLVGPTDEIALPAVSSRVDWEVELGVVIGHSVRNVDEAGAREAIAGFTVMNDVSMRDWQTRTTEFLQGKTFERSSPVGPCLVTPEEIDFAEDLRISCEIDGETMQDSTTALMLTSPYKLISYISQFITLVPGDIIATGTPSGVGAAMDPPTFLSPGQTVRTSIEGIGELVNLCVADGVEALPA